MIFVYKIEVVFLGVTDFFVVKYSIKKLVTCSEFFQEKIIDHLSMLIMLMALENYSSMLMALEEIRAFPMLFFPCNS